VSSTALVGGGRRSFGGRVGVGVRRLGDRDNGEIHCDATGKCERWRPAREATDAEEKRIPDTWVGRWVDAVVVRSVNSDRPAWILDFAYGSDLRGARRELLHTWEDAYLVHLRRAQFEEVRV